MILVDRFNNPAAPPAGGVPWDQPYPTDYRGGTLGGVQAELGYLHQLGVKAIWLSPVLKNCSYLKTYHGYGIQDFTRVEPRFTADPNATRANPDLGRQQLRSLVDAAHALGIYVILDIVLNHTGDVFAYPGGADIVPFSTTPYAIEWRDAQGNPHPEWTEPPPTPDPDAVVWPLALKHSEYFTRQGKAQDTVGDFDDLRQLNTVYQDGDQFPVRNALITAYADIIRTYDIDGFRIDTLKYLAGDTPLVFGNAMREVALTLGKRNFFTFGEVYDSEDTISRFIGRSRACPETTRRSSGSTPRSTIRCSTCCPTWPRDWPRPAVCRTCTPTGSRCRTAC
jgi:glycosidase